MHLKLLQKEQFKEQQKQLVILLEIRLLIRLENAQKLYHRIIQKQMKKKHSEKNVSPELRQKIIDNLRLKEEKNKKLTRWSN